MSAAVVSLLPLLRPITRWVVVSEAVTSRNPLPEEMDSTEIAPESWQPSQPPDFRSRPPLTAAFTSCVQVTPPEGGAPPLATVTGIEALMMLPAASRATAATVWLPSATVRVSHESEYG